MNRDYEHWQNVAAWWCHAAEYTYFIIFDDSCSSSQYCDNFNRFLFFPVVYDQLVIYQIEIIESDDKVYFE